jgi:hypothetical protein
MAVARRLGVDGGRWTATAAFLEATGSCAGRCRTALGGCEVRRDRPQGGVCAHARTAEQCQCAMSFNEIFLDQQLSPSFATAVCAPGSGGGSPTQGCARAVPPLRTARRSNAQHFTAPSCGAGCSARKRPSIARAHASTRVGWRALSFFFHVPANLFGPARPHSLQKCR